MKTEVLTP